MIVVPVICDVAFMFGADAVVGTVVGTMVVEGDLVPVSVVR